MHGVAKLLAWEKSGGLTLPPFPTNLIHQKGGFTMTWPFQSEEDRERWNEMTESLNLRMGIGRNRQPYRQELTGKKKTINLQMQDGRIFMTEMPVEYKSRVTEALILQAEANLQIRLRDS